MHTCLVPDLVCTRLSRQKQEKKLKTSLVCVCVLKLAQRVEYKISHKNVGVCARVTVLVKRKITHGNSIFH